MNQPEQKPSGAIPLSPDPRAGLARALAEVDLEFQAARHDRARLLQDGAQHMDERFPAETLAGRPGDLDHWTWHREAQARAIERGGLREVPELPFVPGSPQDRSESSMVGNSASTTSEAPRA